MEIKILKTNFSTRDDILNHIATIAVKNGFSKNKKDLLKSLIDREKKYTTGFQDGVAIPHSRDKSIIKPVIYIARNAKDIDWKSLDGKPTNLAVSILLPDDELAGSKHIDILANISNYLINDKEQIILKKGKISEIKKILLKEKNEKENIKTKKVYDFVAVSSCPTGVAHTNMAADSLERYAKEKNLRIKVERQGAQGIQNELTEKDIANAKLIIITTGRPIDGKDRFEGKKVYETNVAAPIKDSNKVYKKALKEGKVMKVTFGRKKTLKQAIGSGGATPMQAIMNGVSYMIPLVIVGGILIAISLGMGGKYVSGKGLQVESNSFWSALLGVGAGGFTLMIPILAGFIASAIAGRSALAPAMIIGFIVGNQDGQLFNWNLLQFGGFASSAKLGFIGAIAAGLFVGYSTKLWNVKVSPHFPKMFKPIEPIIIIPMLMVLINWLLFSFFIYVPLFYISFGLDKGIQGLIDKNLFFIAALLLGAMIAFDMGGPINKIAFLLAGGMIAKGKPEVMGAVAAAIAVPPLGTGLAVMTRKLFKVKYDREDRGNAVSAIFMSIIGITEGAIPFAVKYPRKVIIANVIGGSIGAAVASLFKITDNAQHGGPIVYLLGAVGKDGVTNYGWGLFFILAILIGGIITAVTMNVLMKMSQKEKC